MRSSLACAARALHPLFLATRERPPSLRTRSKPTYPQQHPLASLLGAATVLGGDRASVIKFNIRRARRALAPAVALRGEPPLSRLSRLLSIAVSCLFPDYCIYIRNRLIAEAKTSGGLRKRCIYNNAIRVIEAGKVTEHSANSFYSAFNLSEQHRTRVN